MIGHVKTSMIASLSLVCQVLKFTLAELYTDTAHKPSTLLGFSSPVNQYSSPVNSDTPVIELAKRFCDTCIIYVLAYGQICKAYKEDYTTLGHVYANAFHQATRRLIVFTVHLRMDLISVQMSIS